MNRRNVLGPDNNNIVNVNELHNHHPRIRAEDFRSPLVRRLSGTERYADGHRTLRNSYRSSSIEATETDINLNWSGLRDDYNKCINTYQEPIITEFATLGLSCILLHLNVNREITEVTRRGEKADYWIGEREEMIEVSGQQNGDIEELCVRKSVQLLENPFRRPGYVCVAIYKDSKARLWYYQRSEE